MRIPADTAPRHAVVIYNPIKVKVEELKESVNSAAQQAGWDAPSWFETTKDDPGQGLTRRALEEGADLILSAGGDGTVRAVVEALRGSEVAFAIIPSGTGNLLARNLQLPLSDLDQASAIAFGTKQRSIDVGVAKITAADGTQTEHAFMVMAGVGIDAAMIANTSPSLKKSVGWLAYVDGGVRSLPQITKVPIRYSIDDRAEKSAHVSTILVGNCGLLPGNIDLLPDAEIDDGELDIAVLQPKTIFGWLAIWRTVTWENRVLRRFSLGRSYIKMLGSDKKRTITYLRGSQITVSVDEPQPFELDGEDFGEVVSVQLRADPRALAVKVA
ncbi:MAG: diacylglycerol kinase family protein [Microbacteriaceae bacterium]